MENVPFSEIITFPPAEAELLDVAEVNLTLTSTPDGKLSCSTRPERRYLAGTTGGITLLQFIELVIVTT